MTGRPVFSQLNIVVRDMDAAIRFYRLLGLDTSSTAGEWPAGKKPVEREASGGHS